MKQYVGLILAVILHLFVVRGADAQYSWSIVQPEVIGADSNTVYDISCSGSTCTAIGYAMDTTSVRSYRIWNSIDGGYTWQNITPKLHDSLGSPVFKSIVQIDSLHIIIVGNAGLMLKTHDGGMNWSSTVIDSLDLLNVHFSDTLSGIISSVKNTKLFNTLLTTTDGGSSWQKTIFDTNVTIFSVNSDRGQEFRAYRNVHGPIYSTKDNWVNVDSSPPFFENDPNYFFIFDYCSFSNTDTIIVFGMNQTGDFPTTDWRGLLMRSTDNGQTWGKYQTFSPIDSNGISWIYTMTAADNDTIVAGGWSRNKILFSTDNGMSWKMDTLPLPKRKSYTTVRALSMLDNGNVIGIFDEWASHESSAIILGERIQSGVQIVTQHNKELRIHPNPASSFVRIELPEDVSTIIITDAVGRVVISENTKDKEYLVNTSDLTSGSYTVTVKSESDTRPGTFIVTR